MKKHLLFAALLFLGYTQHSMAQCTPDPYLNHTGFSPAILPPAYADAPYNQVLSFYSVKDTVARINNANYDVVIDSVKLLELRGMPAGFSYNCLNNCVIEGGKSGCALITGDADSTQIGSYPTKTFVQTYFRFKIGGSGMSRIDSSDSYTFRIYGKTGLYELVNSAKNTSVKAYPNPSKQHISFDLSALPGYTGGSYRIYDALGRNVIEQSFSNNTIQGIDISSYPKGIYKCHIITATGNYISTFIKE